MTSDETRLNGLLKTRASHRTKPIWQILSFSLGKTSRLTSWFPRCTGTRWRFGEIFLEKMKLQELGDRGGRSRRCCSTLSSREVSASESSNQRCEFRRRRDRLSVRSGIRRQRPHVRLAAASAHQPHRHRESDTEVSGSRSLLQLLPRSATGERMNPYNSIWTGVAWRRPENFTSCYSTTAGPVFLRMCNHAKRWIASAAAHA